MLLGITFTDLSPEAFSFYATTMRENSGRGPSSPRNSGHLAWEWLHSAGQFPAHVPRVMRAALLPGQKSTAHLVDGYGVRNPHVRQLLIDYLQRRRQDMDYKSLRGVTALLVRLFWNRIEVINPAQSNLHLSAEVYEQWRSQVAFLDDGVTVRHDLESLLTTVRGLYFDLQAWAPAEPHLWARWVAPCPVRMTATRAAGTRKRRIHERMADRTRRLQPLLPILSEHVEAEAERWTRLLTACDGAAADSRITVDGRDYRRVFSRRDADRGRGGRPIHVRVRDEATGEVIAVGRREDTAFWHWALVETLRHSGLRIEEVLELSQLSIRQYQRGNGEIVPLLVIAPSRTDRERVIPMSVDLFHVVATIIRRHTRDQPTVPLVCQYDHRERSLSAPLPFLFQRSVGGRRQVFTSAAVVQMLHRICADIAETRPEFAEADFTPHDFRRIFATDLVNSGLPIHIGAALLGHLNLQTTRGYVAVFDEDVIRHYQAHLADRRSLRDIAEYPDVTPQDWVEFEEHFDKRKVELGSCARPYQTPCRHEHACIRCPMLQINPGMLGRLDELEADLLVRRSRAQAEQWRGEIEGIDLTLQFLRQKRTEGRRLAARRIVALGLPRIPPRDERTD